MSRHVPEVPFQSEGVILMAVQFNSSLVPDGFDVRDHGVFFTGGDKPIQVTVVKAWVSGRIRTLLGSDWSVEVAWRDLDGSDKAAVVPYKNMGSKGFLEELAKDGLFVLPGAASYFARFLALAVALPSMPSVRIHRKLGFLTTESGVSPSQLAFMLPYACLRPAQADGAERVEQPELIKFHPQMPSRTFDSYAAAGTLEQWQGALRPLSGNALVVFAVCVGFASPFLSLVGLDNVIFHLYGNSSVGKTTALQAAVSVWGRGSDPQRSGRGRSLIERWNSTGNAMEPMAATHSGLLLAIDELGSSGDAMVSVYNATSGLGKARMSDTGSMRDQHEWSLCILFSGEFSIQEKIEATTKRKAKTGEIIRANDIPVSELARDQSLSTESEGALISQLKQQCGECYGTAGPAFMQAVIDHFQEEPALREWLKGYVDLYHERLLDAAKESGQILGPAHSRAIRRFAFVAAVGCLASQTEALPFTEQVVLQAVASVSSAWLTALPPLSEGERALESIRDYVLRNHSKILDLDGWRESGRSGAPRDTMGIKKGGLLLFTKEQFAAACGDFLPREALGYLRDQGILKREGEKLTCRVDISELGMKRFPFYAVYSNRLLSGFDVTSSEVEQDGSVEADKIMESRDPDGSASLRRSASVLVAKDYRKSAKSRG